MKIMKAKLEKRRLKTMKAWTALSQSGRRKRKDPGDVKITVLGWVGKIMSATLGSMEKGHDLKRIKILVE